MDGIFPIFIPVSKRLLQGLSTLFYVCISLGSGKAVKIIKMFFRESGVWYNMSWSVSANFIDKFFGLTIELQKFVCKVCK